MSPLANVIGVILVGGGVLFFALKFGIIGGPVAVTRERNPFNYWLAVAITAVGVAVAVIVLILTMLGVMRL